MKLCKVKELNKERKYVMFYNLKNCKEYSEKQWEGMESCPVDQPVNFLVAYKGDICVIPGVLTKSGQRRVCFEYVEGMVEEAKEDMSNVVFYGELIGWCHIIEELSIDSIMKKLQESVSHFILSHGINPNVVLMSNDVLNVIVDRLSLEAHDVDGVIKCVKFMGLDVKTVVGKEVVQAVLV